MTDKQSTQDKSKSDLENKQFGQHSPINQHAQHDQSIQSIQTNKLDKYPDTFNRALLNRIMEEKQTELIKVIRKQFYDTTTQAVVDCDQIVTLEFPDKLWQKHRLTLANEILERFGEARMITQNGTVTTSRLTNDKSEIPSGIKKIVIEFF